MVHKFNRADCLGTRAAICSYEHTGVTGYSVFCVEFRDRLIECSAGANVWLITN